MRKILIFLKSLGIILLSILGIFIIVLVIQYFFFSYNENSFGIPKNYFDKTFEHEKIISEDNGIKEFLAFARGPSAMILNGTESKEELENKFLAIREQNLKLDNYMSWGFAEIHACDITETDDCQNDKIDREKFAYNGDIFRKSEKYLEEQIKNWGNLENKKYIKHNYGKNFIDSVFNRDVDIKNFTTIRNQTRGVNQIAIMHIKNGEHEKGIELLSSYIKISDLITNKLYIGTFDTGKTIIAMNNIIYSDLNYILDNYELSKVELEDLLVTLEMPLRDGIGEDTAKAGLQFWKDYIKEGWYVRKVEELNEKTNSDFLSKLVFNLLYSEKDTFALIEKSYYDSIENKGYYYDSLDEYNKSNPENMWKKYSNSFTYKNSENSFWYKVSNLKNYIGRDYVIKNITNPGDLIMETEKEVYEPRKRLIERIKELI